MENNKMDSKEFLLGLITYGMKENIEMTKSKEEGAVETKILFIIMDKII